MENRHSLSSFQLAVLWLRGRIFRDRAARWNQQYASGRWEKLKIPAEQARFDATAGLLTRYAAPGEVLEIGCGEALLQQRLTPQDYTQWVGIDISEVAIGCAQAFASRKASYHVADMEIFDPGHRFDVIVFTESIYYSPDPQALLERYVRYLKPTGLFIVSIFRTKRSDRIWAGLHAVASTIDSTSTTNELGTWDCEVLVPTEATRAGWDPASGAFAVDCEAERSGTIGLVARLFAFATPEGYEDKRGFHFRSGQSGGSGSLI